MDNLGRDMQRMLYILVGIAFLVGGGTAAILIWIIRWLRAG